MLRTILIGTYSQIQGVFVRACRNGEIIVRDGEQEFRGAPVTHTP